jgi:NADPH-dependent 2,4-dienoyl-CoA reductase/sulfur reductase-like enzyme
MAPDKHVVVIGNGIAGVTTAIELRKRDAQCRITIISGESDTFFSRPALMYLYMGHMKLAHTQPFAPGFWAQQRIERKQAWVTHIDVGHKSLSFAKGAPLSYDQLVVATGSTPNKFGWPGQDLQRVQGLYTLQDVASLEAHSDAIHTAVIVGGGLIGIELAEMLHSRGKRVIILARESHYWSNALPLEESQMVERMIAQSGIELRCGEELDAIIDDGQGRACALITKKGERIDCQFVGLTAGVRPNLSALAGSGIETGRGVLVDRSFRTTVPDVFACGDCAEIVTPEGERNVLEQLWYTGKMHGAVLAQVLCGETVTYDRGIWFNSAKFIELEWHTYGHVPGAQRPDERLKHLYWESPQRDRCFRLVLDASGAVVGVNAMGIRYRHQVCEQWIAQKRSATWVIDHLRAANFDPEFYRQHEAAIAKSFREQLR